MQTAERNWEKERWQEDFQTAYQATQRRRMEYNGQKGPLNAYDRKWKRLLVLFSVKVGTTLDSDLLCWHWQDEWAVVRLVDTLDKFSSQAHRRERGGYGRRCRGS